MKNLLYPFFIACFCFLCGACNDEISVEAVQQAAIEYTKHTSDLNIRDPFITVDREEGCYYLITSTRKQGRGALMAYKSLDLEMWGDVGYVFQARTDYIGNSHFWAPDFYLYKGNYYCFITVGRTADPFINMGTTILKGGTSPVDGYVPLLPPDQLNITPADMVCLDGSLYVDDEGVPYMVFCHEWTQAKDGGIWAVRLKDDLSGADGEAWKLFSASESGWAVSGGGDENLITDAPMIWKDKESGNLIMTWSSMSAAREIGVQNYSIGQAISKSGKIEGPWEHDPVPLWSSNGGHGMVFEDLEGHLKIAFHSPNSPSGSERVTIKDIEIKDGKFVRFDPSEYNPIPVEQQKLTYTVKVPAGTEVCYITGNAAGGWGVWKEMTKVDATTFTIQLQTEEWEEYKYFSGPGWDYEEAIDEHGTKHANRQWRDNGGMDEVLYWKNVYTPSDPADDRLTFTVKVPDGTNTCYITGNAAGGWGVWKKMTKVDATTFTIQLQTEEWEEYKYFSGPGWEYEEAVNVNGDQRETNRQWQDNNGEDEVLFWKEVYVPGNEVIVTLKCLVPQAVSELYVIGSWNGWKADPLTEDEKMNYAGEEDGKKAFVYEVETLDPSSLAFKFAAGPGRAYLQSDGTNLDLAAGTEYEENKYSYIISSFKDIYNPVSTLGQSTHNPMTGIDGPSGM